MKKKFEFDYGLYTAFKEMTPNEMEAYLKDMNERDRQLDMRLRQIDHETESLSSAIQRASFQRSLFQNPIDESEGSSKSDRVYYILEHAKQMIEEQAFDIAFQTDQINKEKRKIASIRYVVELLSKEYRIIIKGKYFPKSNWGHDEDYIKEYRKSEKYESRSKKYRAQKAAIEELTKSFNQHLFLEAGEQRKISYSRTIITEDYDEETD